jgi:hypothetical protein
VAEPHRCQRTGRAGSTREFSNDASNTSAGGGTPETVTLTATADSYVSGGATGTNYGTSTTLGVDSDPVEVTYSSHPALGTSIGVLGPTTTNTSYSVPLTVSGLTGELGQQLSLGLDTSSSDGLDLNSKEAGSTVAPKLVLTVE